MIYCHRRLTCDEARSFTEHDEIPNCQAEMHFPPKSPVSELLKVNGTEADPALRVAHCKVMILKAWARSSVP